MRRTSFRPLTTQPKGGGSGRCPGADWRRRGTAIRADELVRAISTRAAQPAELQRRRRRCNRLGRQWTEPVPAGRQRELPGGALSSRLHGDVQRHPQPERLRGRERRVLDELGRRRRLRLERRERVRRGRGLPHRGERGRLRRRGQLPVPSRRSTTGDVEAPCPQGRRRLRPPADRVQLHRGRPDDKLRGRWAQRAEAPSPPARTPLRSLPVAGFTTTTSGCTDVVLSSPQSTVPVCTITNTADAVPLLRLQVRKVVVGSSRPPSDFSFRVGRGTLRFEADGVNEGVVPAGTYTVTEVPAEGFTTTTSGCTGIVIADPPAADPRLHDHEHRHDPRAVSARHVAHLHGQTSRRGRLGNARLLQPEIPSR